MKDYKQFYQNNGGKGKGIMVEKTAIRLDKGSLCRICQRINHLEKDCWYKGKPQIQCRFCKKFGHIEKNCRIKKNQPQGRFQPKNQTAQHANFTYEQENETEELFMAIQSTLKKNSHTWFIDSGCTSHGKGGGNVSQLGQICQNKSETWQWCTSSS